MFDQREMALCQTASNASLICDTAQLYARNPQRPPVHPIAYHAGHAHEGLRIGRILTDTMADLKAWWAIKRQQRIDRAAFQHLLALDDHVLKDIGVTRFDVHRATQLPLSVNAAIELETIARQNKRGR